ncbi:twin-arginine translocase TatA/TatE family subunit [Kribbella sp. NPDC054772]
MMPMLALPEGGEWIVILVIVVLLFGAKKLPELTKNAARAMKEFEKARNGDDDETPQVTAQQPQPTATTQDTPHQPAQAPGADTSTPAPQAPAPIAPAPQVPGDGSGLGGGSAQGGGQ